MFCCIHVVILLTCLHTSNQGLNRVCVLGSTQREFDIGLVNSCNWGNLSRDAPMMKDIYKIPWIHIRCTSQLIFGRTEPVYIDVNLFALTYNKSLHTPL